MASASRLNLDRRGLLRLSGGTMGLSMLGEQGIRLARGAAAVRLESMPFTLGVASGDPAPDGFVLWTRLAPRPLEEMGGMPSHPLPVTWEVASDDAMRTIVASGTVLARPELAHAVHVEVDGLMPGRPYWYRFRVGAYESPIGRGQTLPAPGTAVDRIRFAACGCQHYEEGLFTAWRHIAGEPVDFVFHYGDYIYEGGDRGPGPHKVNGRETDLVRRHIGPECYSLDEYRRRYAQYRLDPDLQAAHAAAPWFVVFDDHEVDNNWAGDSDQDGTPPEIFRLRRAVAMQAYYEHMPLRMASFPDGSHMQLFRRAQFGDLMDMFLLDTRQYRSDQVYGDHDAAQGADVWSTRRTMMGDRQEAWLFDGLAKAQTRWNLLAHQVMIMNLAHRRSKYGELLYSMDQWSGYLYSRDRLLRFIDQHTPGNVVHVTGDAHRHFAGDVVHDLDHPKPVSVEFLATSATSGADGVGDDDGFSHSVRRENPHLKATIDRRGYVLCDVGRDAWIGELKILDKVSVPDGNLSTYARFAVERGKPGLQTA